MALDGVAKLMVTARSSFFCKLRFDILEVSIKNRPYEVIGYVITLAEYHLHKAYDHSCEYYY